MIADAQLVMFAIRSAIRLGEEARNLYADSVRSAAIVLPLPSFPAAPDLSSIENFYKDGDGKPFLAANARVKALLKRFADQGPAGLGAEGKQALEQLYAEHVMLVEARAGRYVQPAQGADPKAPPSRLTNHDVEVLVSVRQWREGFDPKPTVLRRLAGTLINIAVDYAASMPDVALDTSARGRIVAAFLERFQGVDFAKSSPEQLVPVMLESLLEIVAEQPELLTRDKRGQVLAGNVAGAVYDVLERGNFAALTLSEKDRRAALANDVFRAVLRGAASSVGEHPELFLAASSPERADLLQSVSGVLIDALGDVADGQPERAFGSQNFDRMVQAALLAVSRNPQLVGKGSPFLTGLVKTTAADVAKTLAAQPDAGLDARALVPEILRLVLVNSAGNLGALVPAAETDPARHLLVIATREVLAVIAAPAPAGAPWQVRFTEQQALAIVGTVIDEVAQNPGWVVDEAGAGGPIVRGMVVDLLAVLRQRGTVRLSSDVAIAIVRSALRAAGRQYSLKLRSPAGRLYAPLVLDAVLATLFAPDAKAEVTWVALRTRAVEDLVDAVFEVVARRVMNDAALAALVAVLPTALALFSAMGASDLTPFKADLAKALP